MATLRGQEQGFQVVIDPKVWFELKQELDSYDVELARNLRRRIKNAGVVAADKVKETLLLPSPDDGPNRGLNRALLAKATGVSVSFTKAAAGARIVTRSTRLPARHKGLLNVYNMTTFRHPVFGDRETWVNQKGRPYFGAAIMSVVNREVLAEIQAAIDDSLAEVARRRLESKGGL